MLNDGPLFQSQGLIASKVLISKEAYASSEPYDIIQAVIDFVNWSRNAAQLVRGEFPPVAFLPYHADLYLAQVNNGGHRQFIRNTKIPDQTLRNIEEGLLAMGANDFLEIFKEFLALIKSEPDLLNLMSRDNAFQIKTPATATLDSFDDRFFALHGTERLISQNAAWIRSLSCLEILSDDDLVIAKQDILKRNPLAEARKAAVAAWRAEQEAEDPLFVAAKALCAKAKLTFLGFTAGSYTETPGVMLWGVRVRRVRLWGLRVQEGIRFALIGPTSASLFMNRDDVKTEKHIATVAIN